MSKIYRPRMVGALTVPVIGSRQTRERQEKSTEAVRLPIRPKRVSLKRNDHNHADECTVTCDWTHAGIDPRLLDNATLELHIVNAQDELWTPSRQTCRFVGVTKDIIADRSAGQAGTVTIPCVDYTSLFLEAKPFGAKGVPTYDQTLDDAWATIVSQTPGAEVLAKRLVMEGFDTWPSLGSAVAERFRQIGKVPVKPGTDAWAVWQQCVGMMGLISFIDRDQCIVTTARSYYTESDAPVFLWGENLESWHEERHSAIAGKGIGLTSFDPLSGTTLEAFYPPIGDERIKKKRAPAKKVQTDDQIRQSEDREYFTLPGVTSQAALDTSAERVWEERSRQELEGKLTTRDMDAYTEGGVLFDLLEIRAGDVITVNATPENRQILAALSTDGARVRYLKQRGYTDEVADLIVKNLAEIGRLSSRFHVKAADIDLSLEGDGGSFSVGIDYCNRINIDGSAA